MIDPTKLPIEQKRAFGLWPPSPDCLADSVFPYLKRMAKKPVVLVYGGSDGEIEARLLELSAVRVGGVIERIYSKPVDGADVATIMANSPNIDLSMHGVDITGLQCWCFDAVLVSTEQFLDPGSHFNMELETLYSLLNVGGVFAGDNHHKPVVKESLSQFRRQTKVSVPINVSNKLNWFWLKR